MLRRATVLRLSMRRGGACGLQRAIVSRHLAVGTRCLMGGFFSKPGDDLAAAAVEVDPKLAALNVNVNDLANGNDMPPMLQYNEQLVDAASELLERTNRTDDIPAEELDAVSGIVAMLFSEYLVSPWEQYCVVTRLTDIPSCRESDVTLKCVRAIIFTILPDALAQMVCAVDQLPELRNATPEERQRVHRLVQVVIDNGGGGAATTEDVDRYLLDALQGIESGFPTLFNHSNFVYLLQDMNRVCLQARFAYLVNETCLAFDAERTGRISVKDLKASLSEIMPPHAVERFMHGVEPDVDGKIFYPQLALLLMRGDGPVAAEGVNAEQQQDPAPSPPTSSSS